MAETPGAGVNTALRTIVAQLLIGRFRWVQLVTSCYCRVSKIYLWL